MKNQRNEKIKEVLRELKSQGVPDYREPRKKPDSKSQPEPVLDSFFDADIKNKLSDHEQYKDSRKKLEEVLAKRLLKKG
jgi:hypothetical protein